MDKDKKETAMEMALIASILMQTSQRALEGSELDMFALESLRDTLDTIINDIKEKQNNINESDVIDFSQRTGIKPRV